jgi:hypothetical protein
MAPPARPRRTSLFLQLRCFCDGGGGTTGFPPELAKRLCRATRLDDDEEEEEAVYVVLLAERNSEAVRLAVVCRNMVFFSYTRKVPKRTKSRAKEKK